MLFLIAIATGVGATLGWLAWEMHVAPIRNDWESSADERFRRRFGTVDHAPDSVPEDIMELPRLYREPADG